MKSKKLKTVTLLGILLLLFISLPFYFTIERGQIAALKSLTKDVKKYIAENKGLLPSSKEELLNYGVSDLENFNNFEILYGVKISDISTDAKKKLFYKKSGKELFIIRGIFSFDPWMKREYRKSTNELYQEMSIYTTNCD